MKKMIYNTKLKKLLVALLIFMIIFNFVFPNVVFAATIEKTASYEEWINGEETKDYKDIIEKATRTKLREYYEQKYPEDEAAINFAIEQDLSNPSQLIIKGKLNTGIFKSFDISSIGVTQDGFEQNQPVTRKYSEFLEWTGESSKTVDPLIIAKILEVYDIEDDTYVRRN